MKRFILIAVTVLMCLSLVSVHAANEKGFLSITGTTQTKSGNLAIVKVNASSQIAANSISGTLTYDSGALTIFKVIKSDNLEGWDFKIDTGTSGQIKFSGTYSKNGDGPIETERTLFAVQFIVLKESAGATGLSVTASGKGKQEQVNIIETVKNEEEIKKAIEHNENLAEGEEPVEVPEKIIETKEEKKQVDVNIPFDKASFNVNISNPKSKDAYLKSISVKDATISPVFSKLSNAYKVIIDSEKEVEIDYVKEDEKATVVIQQEVNNQIIITVTAEDGTTNAYVLTVIRQKNYDASNPDAPVVDTPTDAPISTIPGTLGVDQNTMILLGGGGAASLVGILIGAVLVISGKKGM